MKSLHFMKSPCPKCPYTLGKVQFIVSPCSSCKINNYQMYHMLTEGEYKNKPSGVIK